jgi:hypothetical protein
VQWEPSCCLRMDRHDEANSSFSLFLEDAEKVKDQNYKHRKLVFWLLLIQYQQNTSPLLTTFTPLLCETHEAKCRRYYKTSTDFLLFFLKYTLALGWEVWPWFSSGGNKPGWCLQQNSVADLRDSPTKHSRDNIWKVRLWCFSYINTRQVTGVTRKRKNVRG